MIDKFLKTLANLGCLLFIISLFSCSKAKEDSAAGRIKGTYSGGMTGGRSSYDNYLVKIDATGFAKPEIRCMDWFKS